MPTSVILLAAGQGTRMKSALPKVLHPVHGRPMVDYVLDAARLLAPERLVAVVGHQAARVVDHLAAVVPAVVVVEQVPQLGTGDAVARGLTALPAATGRVVVVSGDCPLVRGAELVRLVAHHQAHAAAVSLFTAEVAEGGGLGRIVRDGGSRFLRIVEAKDASPAELALGEINTGLYCFDLAFLRAALPNLSRDNAQGELYLTDVVAMAVA
ncbi:MAG: NTP transferase domain-containing protein, partial [Deltaproteobacteria bacterium]|nr:NTP transferase domain-containing protein [Deltaproteobacteria bacterium]